MTQQLLSHTLASKLSYIIYSFSLMLFLFKKFHTHTHTHTHRLITYLILPKDEKTYHLQYFSQIIKESKISQRELTLHFPPILFPSSILS